MNGEGGVPGELEFPSIGYMEEEALRIYKVLASLLRPRERRCGMNDSTPSWDPKCRLTESIFFSQCENFGCFPGSKS